MVDLVRRYALWIALAFLGWYGFTNSGGGMPLPTPVAHHDDGPGDLPPIRGADEEPGSVADPFVDRTPSPVVDTPASDSPATEVAPAAAAEAPAMPAPPEFRPFSVTLTSVLAFGDQGTARINGRTLSLGESLPAVDPESPPVLVSVGGTVATLLHRGRRYELDLCGRATVRVEPDVSGKGARP